MAAAFKAALANVGNAVSGTTISLSTADIAVGDLVVVRWASDNLSATTPTVTASDGTANVYTVLRQGAVNATAAAGVAGGILVCKATVARPFASNLTLTFSGAVTAKAAYAESFTGTLATVRSAAVGTTGTATAASAGASGTVAAGDLVLGFIANETRGVITGDSDTLNGSWSTQVSKSNATSGSDAVCVTAAGQHKIATASGAQTYNVTAVAAEWVIGCVVLQAALVPNTGTAAPSHSWGVTASGARLSKGDAVAEWSTAVTAVGTAPVPPPESAYATRIKSLDPVSYWRLGETSGTVAVDATGHFDAEYTAAPTLGVPSLLTDDADTAMQLFGVTWQGVKAANRVEYQLFTDFTIEAWVKTSGAGSAFRSIFVKQNAYSLFTNDGVLVVYEWGSSAVINTGVNLNDGVRHHVVAAFGVNYGPAESQIYLDGVAVGPPFMHAQLTQAANLDIGYNDYAGQEFIGVIDEAAIYDQRLSAADVLLNYQVGAGIEPSAGGVGSATVAHAWAITATGTKPTVPAKTGSAIVVHAWATTASGTKPTVPAKTGSAIVAHAWATAASGVRPSIAGKQGSAAFSYVETVTAAGVRPVVAGKQGSAAFTYVTTVTAAGTRPAIPAKTGSAAFTYVATVTAGGIAPVLLVGYYTMAMQYGDQPVVAWQMNGQGAPV